MLRLRRPDDELLGRVLAEQRELAPRYPGVGGTTAGHAPPGFHHDRFGADLGTGSGVFDRAVAALREWGPQRGAGLAVRADGPIATGTTVALAAPLPVGYAVAACRIVATTETEAEFAFAYGTLPLHPEEGEERFAVVRDAATGAVRFEIRVFSRPKDAFARLGAPVARRLQRQTTERYLAAMERATAR